MTKKRLNQYKGRLSAQAAADGINAARRNAERLAEDARLLLNQKRFPSACALAALSIEEAGKSEILRRIALALGDDELREAWRDYRTHTSKNRKWPILDLVAKGARKLQDFAGLYHDSADHPMHLDQMKQLSFYTDCLGNGHWSVPENVIEERLAILLVITSECLAKGDDVSGREIELWITHLGPVWRQSRETMERGLCEWYAAMQHEGLAPSGDNLMRKFILQGMMPTDSGDASQMHQSAA